MTAKTKSDAAYRLMHLAFASDLDGYLAENERLRELGMFGMTREQAKNMYYDCGPNIGTRPA